MREVLCLLGFHQLVTRGREPLLLKRISEQTLVNAYCVRCGKEVAP